MRNVENREKKYNQIKIVHNNSTTDWPSSEKSNSSFFNAANTMNSGRPKYMTIKAPCATNANNHTTNRSDFVIK